MDTFHEGQVERANTLEQQAAAPSGSHNASEQTLQKPRQLQNDQGAMEPLLVILFAWLLRGSQAMSGKERTAHSLLTLILQKYVFRILSCWRVPDAWHQSEDIVQTVLSRFLTWHKAAQYSEARATRTSFLLGTLRNVLSEERRKLKPARTAPLIEDVVDSARRHDEEIAIRDEINVAMKLIGANQAHALRVQYGLEEPSEEFLALTPPALYSLTWRAKQALRAALIKLSDR